VRSLNQCLKAKPAQPLEAVSAAEIGAMKNQSHQTSARMQHLIEYAEVYLQFWEQRG
jgi:hypothetical protein